jgi:hypothetical protein
MGIQVRLLRRWIQRHQEKMEKELQKTVTFNEAEQDLGMDRIMAYAAEFRRDYCQGCKDCGGRS